MIALVTGGAKGIGLGISKKLLEEGYFVLIASRNESAELQELRNKYPNQIAFVACDIGKKESRDKLFEYVKDNELSIDLLVNNAGVAPKMRKDILEIDEQDFDYLIDVNLKGTYFIAQGIANMMKERKSGRIVNISSISSYTASTNRGEYCIAKAGISMITKLFAAKMAEYNVGVFEIMPGVIDTSMTAVVHEKYEKMINDGLTPIKRFGTPEDIANCVSCIASGNLDFCTGQVLNADGGFSIRRL